VDGSRELALIYTSPEESDRRIEAGQRCEAEQLEPICTDFTGDFEDLGIYLVANWI
jgi:hypothetical protein